MLNKYRIALGVLAGLPLVLIYQIGILIIRGPREQFYLLKNIYFLNNFLGPFFGPLVIDYGRFFISGAIAAAISYKRPLLAAILVGILGPIIGTLLMDVSFRFDPTGSSSFKYFLFSMFIFSLAALAGGLFYKFILRRFFVKNLPSS